MADPLHVFAAGSLRAPFAALAALSTGEVRVSYANARDLAERIVAGEPADVFASASPQHPRDLHAAGLVGEPRAFASNRLVVAVPVDSPARDAGVLAASGSRVVIEVEGIPLGDYTRAMLARLDEVGGSAVSAAVLANVVAEEHTVDAVAARLEAGEADAAVLYATDVVARPGRLRALEPPAGCAVGATYVACATATTPRAALAAAWVDRLTGTAAARILSDAGFGPPPPGP